MTLLDMILDINNKGLSGIIEMDEMQISGKVKGRVGSLPLRDKQFIFGLIERNGGRCYLFHIPKVNAACTEPLIKLCCRQNSVIMTDEAAIYVSRNGVSRIEGMNDKFKHFYVNHSKEMVNYKDTQDDLIHIQNCENMNKQIREFFYKGVATDQIQLYLAHYSFIHRYNQKQEQYSRLIELIKLNYQEKHYIIN